MVAEFCSFFFATLGLLLSILVYELRIAKGSDLGTIKLAALIYEVACTIFLVCSICIRYALWLQWAKTVEMFT